MTRLALSLFKPLLRQSTFSVNFSLPNYSFGVSNPINRAGAAFLSSSAKNSHHPSHEFDTMSKKVILATCSLNQWANDFKGNYERIRKSVVEAKAKGARFRLGPELEIPGYSCQDHFLEYDTEKHSWEVLSKLLQDEKLHDIIIDTGMPVRHKQTIYNCRVLLLNGKILFVRPKLVMCDTGNYRESRWFTAWRKLYQVEEFLLPTEIQKVTGQRSVPIGDAILMTKDTSIGTEICEELWAPLSKHIALGLDGVEIITNASSSHHELRKAHRVFNMIHSATLKGGGIYLYANQFGCDGDRLNFNGIASIALNGQFVVQGRQFAVADVEVLTAIVDLTDVRGYRGSMSSRGDAASTQTAHPVVEVDFTLGMPSDLFVSLQSVGGGEGRKPSPTPEEEIALGPAVWLWDYLRRSKQAGYLLPLSGGTDSSATACIVYSMCTLVVEAAKNGDEQVLADIRAVTGDDKYTPESAQEFCSRIFVTVYMASKHSSNKTRERARNLAGAIGSVHREISIDDSVEAVYKQFSDVTGKTPRIGSDKDIDPREDLAQQNVQARIRMVMAYHFAKLMPWTRGGRSSLLVLGSANVDESLRGYLTKYDCSSADVNPIGGISKTDLRKFLGYCAEKFDLAVLNDILHAKPTAELRPLDEAGAYSQTDEDDMGMSYEELSMYGRLRKQQLCGPLSMFERLAFDWRDKFPPKEVARKVKDFFKFYAINRHKMTTLTPAYHAESYSPDDNRFDHRQFLYNINWDWQFEAIDREADRLEKAWSAHKSKSGGMRVDAEMPAETMVANEKN